jgi:hypothetical protein
MLTEQQKKAVNILLTNAKTKDGELIPEDKTQSDISAVSFYYMMDKDVWQLKVWFYPTNKSKTYNLLIDERSIHLWKELFTIICKSSMNINENDPWS